MTNHNTLPERHDHPFHANEKSRKIIQRSLMAVGGLAVIYAMTNNLSANPEKHLDKFHQPTQPLVTESVYENGPPESTDYVTSVIKEGDATSVVVEKATIQLAQQENFNLKEGQLSVNHESSLYIEDLTKQRTGGSVQPGHMIESWLDPETGYVVSAPIIDNAK